MTIRTDTHVVIDLTQAEVLMLKDILSDIEQAVKERGSSYERLWMDLWMNLLFSLPSERP